ncbi:cysteine desulfurase [Testudinibacter aquarius]|uniref:cysteine desulfurase n=1 Tax=Testudinibacter aquarius TaxID=1524974 RepID=A0A4R3Y5P9_9PAST|nr:cysteine desulfurase [Testudinibacter aquarius]KAE9526277.1 cysteine desulfurase [Testudinibacter aquarius]TCV87087.1 cysteine sulfinate desulfinase [Testudinibacter aquarius]TNG87406.1 aminotransferase class V-fold PLP-dependent enzyme [Testudinibacter aquarius]
MFRLESDFNPALFRQAFPYLQSSATSVYLDSAATALKPQVLIDSTLDFYQSAGSVHRSQYDAEQTALYEQARNLVAELINAPSPAAVIWTSGATQAINSVAHGLAHWLEPGDEIVISEADHHANFVTWSMLAQQCAARLIILPINDQWQIESAVLRQALSPRSKIVAFNMVSNVTGTEQPIAELINTVRQNAPQALILLDCAQAVAHLKLDIQALDADFYVFSAHKLYGPNGLGVLSGKPESLEKLTPLLYGGKMVDRVSKQQISFNPLPYRLEAGTPNIAAVIGFGTVLNWLGQYDLQQAEAYAVALAEQTKVRLQRYDHVRLFNSPQPSSIVCFVFDDIAVSDLSTLLSEQGIALRAGEHCAQPYLARLGQKSTLRLSFAPYNTSADVEAFFAALDRTLTLLRE